MKPKTTIFISLLTNLILGNLLLPLGRGKYETLGGKLYVHIVCSIVAITLLLLLFRLITEKTKKYRLVVLPVIFSYLVPLISVYMLFFIIGVSSGDFKSIIVGLPIALISSFVSWFLWLPFGFLNFGFVYIYSKSLRENIS